MSNLNMRLFSCVLLIYYIADDVWLVNESQNAILNTFEEYYNYLCSNLQSQCCFGNKLDVIRDKRAYIYTII